MFDTRLKSHHDAQQGISRLLSGENNHHKYMTPLDWSHVEDFLNSNGPGSDKKGCCVYIHIPYCDKICSFCNLNRSRGDNSLSSEYAGYLISEIENTGRYRYIGMQKISVVYMGGGTPTILKTADLERVLQALHKWLPLTPDCEISVESTLHNLSPEKLSVLEAQGVNRLSIGIQTFNSTGRRTLGRSGTRDYSIQSIQKIRENFKGILGVDIIYSYPGQSEEALIQDAQDFLSLNLDGTSFYSLMIHEGSELARRISAGELVFSNPMQADRKRHHLFMGILEESGYEILELSKLVKPGRDEYRYIKLRYENKDVIPIGNGAGGSIGPFRIYRMAPGKTMVMPVNPAYDRYNRLLGYFQFGRYSKKEILSTVEGLEETQVDNILNDYRRRGFFRPNREENILNDEGVFWGNNLAVDFLEKITITNNEGDNL